MEGWKEKWKNSRFEVSSERLITEDESFALRLLMRTLSLKLEGRRGCVLPPLPSLPSSIPLSPPLPGSDKPPPLSHPSSPIQEDQIRAEHPRTHLEISQDRFDEQPSSRWYGRLKRRESSKEIFRTDGSGWDRVVDSLNCDP